MLKLTSDRLVGPLKNLRDSPFYVVGFGDLDKVSIGFIGDTYAGKTRYIRTLTNVLGGVYQEETDLRLHSSDRTLNDSSYVFGEVKDNGLRRVVPIKLRSHAGHNIGRGDEGPKAEHNVFVLKYLKSSTFNKQLKFIEPILRKEEIDFVDVHCLVTRCDSQDDLTTRRKNTIIKRGFKDILYINNKQKHCYDLSELDEKNVDLILSVLGDEHPSLKLIYFGEKEVPARLEDRLVNFDGQFDTALIPEEGFKYDKDPMINSIWKEMQRGTITF